MFSPPLDVLLIFTVTTPIIGWVSEKIRLKSLCGAYASFGLAFAGYMLYQLARQVFSSFEAVSLGIAPFGSYLRIDSLSIFIASIFISLGFLAAVYSIKYMEKESGVTLYYTLLLAMISGLLGVVFAGDFFTLYVFWELMCVSSYVLVAFRKHLWEPIEAGLKYLVISAAGSATILLGLSIVYGLTGTLNFAELARVAPQMATGWAGISLTFIVAGFGVKAAIFPFHTWLPDAHPAAPSPISALLSGIVIKAGVYAILRSLFTVFPPTNFSWQTVLAIISILTMSFGNLAALLQEDIKRLLAYSSIAQIGYIFFAISAAANPAASNIGLTAALLHILNHALMKGLLFLCAGAFIYMAGTRKLRELAGIGRKMPLTAIAFTIGALAISGLPSLNGFVSELMIVYAGINANMPIYTAILLANILLGFAYYLRLIKSIVWSTSGQKPAKARDPPALMLIPIMILAITCIIIGLYPSPFIEIASKAAETLTAPT
ncbi:hypothetical protein DRO54_02380 [Candidatus Bathyarchaeota archaeon]|nr:MAG: hypothetical protein DRO54_02380 [Candidatus Bathyarchaeota archaeon]